MASPFTLLAALGKFLAGAIMVTLILSIIVIPIVFFIWKRKKKQIAKNIPQDIIKKVEHGKRQPKGVERRERTIESKPSERTAEEDTRQQRIPFEALDNSRELSSGTEGTKQESKLSKLLRKIIRKKK